MSTTKSISILTQGMVFLLVGVFATAGLTFVMFNGWGGAKLLQRKYAEAKHPATGSEAQLDKIFLGPQEPQLKDVYQVLTSEADKKAYQEAKKAEQLDQLFDAKLRPPTWIPWACLAALIVFVPLMGKAFGPLFVEQSKAMVVVTLVIGVLGGYYYHLYVADTIPMGIDLAGGTELIYRLDYTTTRKRIAETESRIETMADLKARGEKDPVSGKLITDEDIRTQERTLQSWKENMNTASEKAAEIVRKRIDPNGTRGIPVTQYGQQRLRIQLPKASPEEVERIETAIMKQGRLTFHIVQSDNDIIQKVKESKDKETSEYKVMYIEKKTAYGVKEQPTEVVIYKDPCMEGARIVFATFGLGQEGGFEVHIRFDSAGASQFEQVTRANVGKQMAIVLDNVCYSAPVIKSAISADCQITGNFTEKEAEALSSVLTAGSLPAEVKSDTKLVVGPSLGREQIQSGLQATLIGTLLVSLFMWIYYRLCGFIAVLCLGVNLAVLMGGLGFFNATMTLPGIAGILLTLGMAVDANVLIYERIREESGRGRTIKQSVQYGFDRAAITIIDSQLTTLLSGVILYYFGTGPVRGFAITLSLGILVTLFANLWVCKLIFYWLISREAIGEVRMMQLFKPTHFDFMGMRRPWIISTGISALLALTAFLYMGPITNTIFDLDFTGGSLIQFNFNKGNELGTKAVQDVVDEKVKPQVKGRIEKVVAAYRKIAAEGGTEEQIRKGLEKELPELAHLHFGTAAKLTKESLLEQAQALEDGVLRNYDQYTEFKVKSYSAAIAGQGDEKYQSFTLMTRISNPETLTILDGELKSAFAGKLQPVAVSADREQKVIRVRFNPDSTRSDDQLVGSLQQKLKEAAGEKDFEAIKEQLKALVISPVGKERHGEVEYRSVTLKPLPEKPEQVEAVLSALNETRIQDRAEGAISRKNTFGSEVAGEMKWSALLAGLGGLLGIFLYLWFRYNFTSAWGIGAILALIHDALIAIGAVCLVNYLGILPIYFDLNLLAAVLTIIGYSVNDTIVVYDRIREVMAQHPTRDFGEVINEATNATLSRTILTAGVTQLSVLALFLFGGETIRGLSFALLVGFTAGCYSSIFIASPLVRWWVVKYGVGRAPIPGVGQPVVEAGASGAQI